MSERPSGTGLLFAAAGTTCPEAMGAFECINRAAATRFPGVVLKWAYTSSGVRRKLIAQGRPIQDPREALATLEAEGVTQCAVLSLHLSDGMEFGELVETVAAFAERKSSLARLTLGRPILTSEQDAARVFAALRAPLPHAPVEDEAVVFVAHGSTEPAAVRTLQAAVSLCRRIDRRLFLGMMLGAPSLEDVLQECKAASVKKACLVPLMIAAGYSARDDIAGAGAGTWKSRFEAAGILCSPVLKGMGDNEAVVDIWMDHADELLKRLKA
jgi:sirohydrochlorin cobaltochelatase